MQTLPLSSLSDSRLGIDAAHYIRKLLGHENTREVLVAATGGLPIALITQIESDLRVLERLRIKPVFVFPGLPLVRPLPPKGQDFGAQREAGVKNNAWLAYENGDAETAARILTQARQGAWTEYRDVARLVLRIFRHRMVEYIIAPYMQWAQVSLLACSWKLDFNSLARPSCPTCKATQKPIFTRSTPRWRCSRSRPRESS